MRLIDADAMREDWLENGENEHIYDTNAVLDSIDAQPTVDAMPLRCRIGDVVWVVGTKCLSNLYDDECRAEFQGPGYCDTCHLDQEYIVFHREVNSILFCYIHDLDESKHFKWGETVFKTYEEAAAALSRVTKKKDDENLIDDVISLIKAQQKAEEAGETEFICPLCGGKAWWGRAEINNHLHCGCTDCGFKMME